MPLLRTKWRKDKTKATSRARVSRRISEAPSRSRLFDTPRLPFVPFFCLVLPCCRTIGHAKANTRSASLRRCIKPLRRLDTPADHLFTTNAVSITLNLPKSPSQCRRQPSRRLGSKQVAHLYSRERHRLDFPPLVRHRVWSTDWESHIRPFPMSFQTLPYLYHPYWTREHRLGSHSNISTAVAT